MIKPGIIYHKDTRGKQGFHTLENMVKENIHKDSYCHAIHYATSVFEGIRAVYDKKQEKLYLINIDQHIDRFMNSMRSLFLIKPRERDVYETISILQPEHLKELDLKPPTDDKTIFLDINKEEIKKVIIESIKLNVNAENINIKKGCYVRPIAFRDKKFNEYEEYDPSLGVYALTHDVVLEIESFEWGKYLEGNPNVVVYSKGIDSPLRNIKAGANYGFGGMGKNWAVYNGFDEVLITDSKLERNVLEGGGENLFVLKKNGTIITPHKDQSILPGTKRAIAIEIAKNYDMDIIEREMPLEEFFDSKAAAFTGTATGIETLKSVYDPLTNNLKIFDTKDNQLNIIKRTYEDIITGKEISTQNKRIQDKIRTEIKLDNK